MTISNIRPAALVLSDLSGLGGFMATSSNWFQLALEQAAVPLISAVVGALTGAFASYMVLNNIERRRLRQANTRAEQAAVREALISATTIDSEVESHFMVARERLANSGAAVGLPTTTAVQHFISARASINGRLRVVAASVSVDLQPLVQEYRDAVMSFFDTLTHAPGAAREPWSNNSLQEGFDLTRLRFETLETMLKTAQAALEGQLAVTTLASSKALASTAPASRHR